MSTRRVSKEDPGVEPSSKGDKISGENKAFVEAVIQGFRDAIEGRLIPLKSLDTKKIGNFFK